MKIKLLCSLLLLFFITYHASAQEMKDDFKPNGKITSQVFGDYYYVAHSDTGILHLSKTALNKNYDANGFRLRRANLGYEYNFAQNFSSLIRLETDESALTVDSKMGFFIKDAYVKWGLSRKIDLLIGLQSTFSYEESDKIWGHRYIERTIMDIRGVASSRDFGLSIRGKFTDDGKFFYNLMVANNSSVKIETNKYKKIYANIGYRPTEAICLILYSDYSAKERIDGKSKNEILSGIFMGYKKDKVSIGIEGFNKISENAYTVNNNFNNMNTLGTSLFGSYKFAKKWDAYARVDFWDNNIAPAETNDSRVFAVGGVAWVPISGFTLSPNIQVETYEKTITRNIDPSIWALLTFQWQLK